MLHNSRVVFIDGNNTVLNVIVGDFDEQMMRTFVDYYAKTSDAVFGMQVDDPTVPIWIGGKYENDAGFVPPVEPEIVDGTATLIQQEQPIELQEPQP